jgi:hypothetical protein
MKTTWLRRKRKATLRPTTRSWAVGTALLLALAALLVGFAMLLLFLQWMSYDSPGSTIPGGGDPLADARLGSGLCMEEEAPSVTLIAERLLPSDAALEARFVLCLPPEVRNGLRDADHGFSPLAEARDSGLVLRPRYAERSVELRLECVFPYSVERVEIPLPDLFATLGSSGVAADEDALVPVDNAEVTLPLYGDAASYPLDSYGLEFFADLELPSGILLERSAGGNTSTISLTVRMVADPEAAALASSVRTSGPSAEPRLQLLLNRPFRQKAFVAMLLAVPLIFAGLAAPLLLGSGRAGERARVEGGAITLVGAVLAILPIRQVLVPPDSGSLTFVDGVLGFEVALFTALALVSAALRLERRRRAS